MVFAENKRAYFEYEILKKFEAGISLIGQEVKSIRLGRIGLAGTYVVLRQPAKGGYPEAYLVGANIPAYQPKNAPADYNPKRSRKLLLKKSEIKELIGKTKEKGLTLIPLKVYNKKGKIKIEFGIAKKRKKRDKRELLKKRDIEREMRRILHGSERIDRSSY